MHRSIAHPLSRLRTRRSGPAPAEDLPGGQPVCDCAEATARGRADAAGRHLHAVPEREAGITTAEYAVGTAAGAGLAGLLYTMLSGGFGDQLLTTLFDHVLGLLGVG